MAEYIEREALRNAVESIDWYSVCRGKLTTGAKSSENALYKANDIYAAIDNAPSADVAQVRHGRWLCVDADTEQFFLCNRCKKKEYWESNYCPNCGAKMNDEATDNG